MRVGNAGIGLLVTVSSLVGALTALPCGVLADRMSRTGLLSISIMVWGAAELLSAFSTSFAMLLGTRLALGAVMATGGPTVASLTGDLFPARERTRIYGLILTGELLGGGAGVLLAGDIGAAVSWRVGLAILAIPSVVLAWAIRRYFPEPARGGQSRLMEGDQEILTAEEVSLIPPTSGPGPDGDDREDLLVRADEEPVLAMIEESDVSPDDSLVLPGDSKLSLWEAVRWVFASHQCQPHSGVVLRLLLSQRPADVRPDLRPGSVWDRAGNGYHSLLGDRRGGCRGSPRLWPLDRPFHLQGHGRRQVGCGRSGVPRRLSDFRAGPVDREPAPGPPSLGGGGFRPVNAEPTD